MKNFLVAAASGLIFAMGAQAQAPASPRAQLAAETKAAQTRYASDKNLCNDEATSSARLQCRRDAKAEYDAAIAAAKAKVAVAPAPAAAPVPVPVACPDCGKVTAVSMKEEAGTGGPVGLIAGGVGGAVLGHQIGSGRGKDLATIAGAVGGAYAGKKIEEKVNTKKVWTVGVTYQNGTHKEFAFEQDPGYRVGDSVRNAGTSLTRQ
jgi:uncharacterized protein YcfJ